MPIDLHNHLLPALDDGAVDLEETLSMARTLAGAGYTDVATTPHHKPDLAPAASVVETRRAEVQAILEAEGIPLRLHPGRENHLTPELIQRVEDGTVERLGAGAYVLLELPFFGAAPRLRDLLFRIQLRGYRPLLAHPERCAHFLERPDAAREVVDAGGHLQIEVGSVSGLYGGVAQRCAASLLDQGLVAVAATDAHRPRSTAQIVTSGLAALEKRVGPRRFALLVEENPGRVLRGESLLPV